VIEIGLAGPAAATALATIHAECFDPAWSASEIATLLEAPGAAAALAWIAGDPAGFVLVRTVADEAEILTIATRPLYRRRGIGAALLADACARARAGGAAAMFLEVAEDNPAARGLYAAAGFVPVGRRRAYYSRAQGSVSALILRLDLNL
jgi:[ribosomal protein S18]-alanine N-acetyltransferase